MNQLQTAALGCGFAMILITIIMMNAFPQSADLPEGYTSPIIAFEFARSESDIAYLIGQQQASVENRQGMRNGHQWDMIFPFAYAGLLFALLLQFYPKGRARLIALLSCALIVPFDINENLVLLGIVDAAQGGDLSQGLFDTLYVATWLKWGAIAVAVGFLAIAYARGKNWLLAIAGAAYSVLAAACLLLNSPPQLIELMTLVLSVFFLFAFIYQLYTRFRPKQTIKA